MVKSGDESWDSEACVLHHLPLALLSEYVKSLKMCVFIGGSSLEMNDNCLLLDLLTGIKESSGSVY